MDQLRSRVLRAARLTADARRLTVTADAVRRALLTTEATQRATIYSRALESV